MSDNSRRERKQVLNPYAATDGDGSDTPLPLQQSVSRDEVRVPITRRNVSMPPRHQSMSSIGSPKQGTVSDVAPGAVSSNEVDCVMDTGRSMPMTQGIPRDSDAWYGIPAGSAISRMFKKFIRFGGFASRGEYGWGVFFVCLFLVPLSIILFSTWSMLFDVEPVDFLADEQLQNECVSESMLNNDYNGMVECTQNTLQDNVDIMVIIGKIAFGVLIFVLLVFFFPWLSLTIRRVHDAGFSGVVIIPGLVLCGIIFMTEPAVGLIVWLIVVLCIGALPTRLDKQRLEWADPTVRVAQMSQTGQS